MQAALLFYAHIDRIDYFLKKDNILSMTVYDRSFVLINMPSKL